MQCLVGPRRLLEMGTRIMNGHGKWAGALTLPELQQVRMGAIQIFIRVAGGAVPVPQGDWHPLTSEGKPLGGSMLSETEECAGR